MRWKNVWGPFLLAGFDDIHGEQSFYLLLSEVSRLRPCAIWWRLHWSIIRFVKLYLVLHYLNRTKVSVSLIFILFEHIKKLLAKARIFCKHHVALRGLKSSHCVMFSPECVDPLAQNDDEVDQTNRINYRIVIKFVELHCSALLFQHVRLVIPFTYD